MVSNHPCARWLCRVIACLVTVTAARGAELTVVSVEPAAHTLTASVNTSIVVRFDTPVDRSSFTGANAFWAFGRWSGRVSGSISFTDADGTVVLTPNNPFSAGETVMVILSHDLAAADGSPFRSAGYSYQFWTRSGAASLDFVEIDRLSTRTVPTASSRAYGGFASDLNGDGFVDVCVANINDNTVSVLLGVGDGTFGPQQLIAVGNAPRGIAVLDADGDGDTDIAVTNQAGSNVSLILNDGNGVFGPANPFDPGGAAEWALAAADMNDDGLLDLVIGDRDNNQILVSRANGDGTFTTVGTQSCGGAVWMLVCGDVNGDGTEDVATVNSSTDNGAILLGNGTGQLLPPALHSLVDFPLATDLGDLDGDGDLDWVTSSFNLFGPGAWSIFTNDGSGTYSHLRDIPAVDAASCSLLLDFDNDLDLDLALIDEIEDEVVLMKNKGTPVVPAVTTWGLVANAVAILAAGFVVMRRHRPKPALKRV